MYFFKFFKKKVKLKRLFLNHISDFTKVFLFLNRYKTWRFKMARIIEGGRRIIKMSVDDILSVVQDYQRIVPRFSTTEDARDYLSDTVVYIPEDI